MDKRDFYDSLPQLDSADIIVIGGGLAGCSAAIAAARTGAETLLIEAGGCLGGIATTGLVAPLSSYQSRDKHQDFGGILQEFLTDVSETAGRYCTADTEPQSAVHLYKYILLEKLVNSGAKLLFHLFVTDVVSDTSGKIEYLVVASKDGLKRISGKIFIDTTGDGDVMGKTAADTIVGSEVDALENIADAGVLRSLDKSQSISKDDYVGKLQPVSLMMQFGGVDSKRAWNYINRRLTYAELGTTKEAFSQWKFANTLGFEMDDSAYIPSPQGRVWFHSTIREDIAVVNMSRIHDVNACDPQSYSDAEVKAGLQLIAIIDFLKTFVPGFENAYFMESASTLGVRESRRLIGEHLLRGDEVFYCVRFPDVIAHGSYIIDIHDPKGKRMSIASDIAGNYFSIPYKSLITSKVPNLLTAGRSISADHVAHGATRIQGTVMLTGQATGTAAALALNSNCTTSEVDVKALQTMLRNANVFLDIP